MNEEALHEASKKLRKLRLTDVGGRKEHPAETVKSVFERGLGGMYDDDAITYVLRHGIQYYRDAQLRIGADNAGQPCPRCLGSGRLKEGYNLHTCPSCDGSGQR